MKLRFRKKLAFALFRQFRKNTTELHQLNTLFWETTLRCNLECLHCGSDCSQNSVSPDMPLADFLKVLTSISKHIKPKKIFIIFSGGEPLMRTDLEDCGKAVTNMGFKWGMVTNGLALTPQRFKSLLQAGLYSLTISLDGLEDSHNTLRQNKHSHTKAIEAITMAASIKKFPFDVVTCVSCLNLSELEKIKDLLISLKVKHWRINTIFPVGRGGINSNLHLNNSDFTRLLQFIEATRKENKIQLSYSCEGFLGEYEGKVRDSFYFCRAGINIGSILVDGSISACTNMRSNFIQGNIYKDDFMTVWNTKFAQHRNREWSKKDACKDCEVFNNCLGNGLHLYNEKNELQMCHYNKIM